MLVYRVAHPAMRENGYLLGPYRARSQPEMAIDVRMALEAMSWAHTNTKHPNPAADGIRLDQDRVCGFAAVNDLRDWFHGYLKLLDRGRFRVFAYDVPKRCVDLGHVQLMFDPREAFLRGSWGIWSKVPAMTARWARCLT